MAVRESSSSFQVDGRVGNRCGNDERCLSADLVPEISDAFTVAPDIVYSPIVPV